MSLIEVNRLNLYTEEGWMVILVETEDFQEMKLTPPVAFGKQTVKSKLPESKC